MSVTLYNPGALLSGLIKAHLDQNAARRFVKKGDPKATDKNEEGVSCAGHIHPESNFWQALGVTVNDNSEGELASYGWSIERFKQGWLTRWAQSHDQGDTNENFLKAFLGGPDSEEAGKAWEAEMAMRPNFFEALIDAGAEVMDGPEIPGPDGIPINIKAISASMEQVIATHFAKLDPREALDKINEMSVSHGHDPENPESECETIQSLRARFGGVE